MSRSYILEKRAPRPGDRKEVKGFTPGQQKHYRPLVDRAWEIWHARHPAAGWVGDEAKQKRVWYESELENATGHRSSTECNRTRDFTQAIAHFEAIIGESIFWQMKLFGDDKRRVIWNIRGLVRANEVTEDYMRGIARRMLRLGDDAPLPTLDEMEEKSLLVIMGELKRFLRRGGRPGVKQGEGEIPF